MTAIRFPGDDVKQIEKELTRAIDPASLGFFFRDIKKEGLQASSYAVDFDQLFLGLSFFIIVAALLLTGLLYVFTSNSDQKKPDCFWLWVFPKTQLDTLFCTKA